jgi:corrinoid protein of di/trimethylamine methyltransferase
MFEAVLSGEDDEAKSLAEKAVAQGIDPMDAVNKGFLPGMNEAGEKFSRSEYFVPDLLLSARAMRAGLDVLLPMVKAEKAASSRGRVLIGTVEGDIHDIGKTIVGTLLESAGFAVEDLGVDVPAKKFIEGTKEEKPDVLGLSCLLTSTMPAMASVIQELKELGLRDKVKVIVGGAPITDMYAKKIGADAFGDTAKEAVEVVNSLIRQSRSTW